MSEVEKEGNFKMKCSVDTNGSGNLASQQFTSTTHPDVLFDCLQELPFVITQI